MSKLWQKLGCEARFQMKAQVPQESNPGLPAKLFEIFQHCKRVCKSPLFLHHFQKCSFLVDLFLKDFFGVPTVPWALFSAVGKHLQLKQKPLLLWSSHSSFIPCSALLIFIACACVHSSNMHLFSQVRLWASTLCHIWWCEWRELGCMWLGLQKQD